MQELDIFPLSKTTQQYSWDRNMQHGAKPCHTGSKPMTRGGITERMSDLSCEGARAHLEIVHFCASLRRNYVSCVSRAPCSFSGLGVLKAAELNSTCIYGSPINLFFYSSPARPRVRLAEDLPRPQLPKPNPCFPPFIRAVATLTPPPSPEYGADAGCREECCPKEFGRQ